jgi:hypothetical protein
MQAARVGGRPRQDNARFPARRCDRFGSAEVIAVANAIEGEPHDHVAPELVAEAWASGVGWGAIGKF